VTLAKGVKILLVGKPKGVSFLVTGKAVAPRDLVLSLDNDLKVETESDSL
jgi:hypothetical protein